MNFAAQDERFMRRALTLARRGLGWTSPNPAVGAVLVRNGQIIGEGWHRQAGGPHAEILALQDAQRRNARVQGATLYVTLEPCCTYGRTPPCTDAIVAAGIRRVVVAATDPNPRHRGRGLRLLRRAGVQVENGLLAAEAMRLNAAFNHWICTGRPFVVAKAALSLDGKIATRTGDSRWITNLAARREAHRLRAQVDAVMVGAGTVIRDDPALTVRHGITGRQPWRVVVDGRGRCPLTARLFRDAHRQRTLVVTTRQAPANWRRALETRGVTVWLLPTKGSDVSLRELLRRLGKQQITSVLVEGGATLLGEFFDRGLVNRVVLFYAPIVLGGRDALSAVTGLGVARVGRAWRFSRNVQWRRLAGGQAMFQGDAT